MFVADTHAWVYYLLNNLPFKSNQLFYLAEQGDETIFVPAIALSECVYLAESGKIKLNLDEIFSKFEKSSNFIVAPLDFEIIKLMPNIRLKEIHDRIIVATSKLLNAPLITKDKEIINSNLVKTIW